MDVFMVDNNGQKNVFFNNHNLVNKYRNVSIIDLDMSDFRLSNLDELKEEIINNINKRGSYVYEEICFQMNECNETFTLLPDYKREELPWVNSSEIFISDRNIEVRRNGTIIDLKDVDVSKVIEANEITYQLEETLK